MIQFLFGSANAPYTLALLVVVFYVLLQVVGLLSWGEHGHDVAADGHDVEVDGDAHLETEAHAETDHDVDHEAEGGFSFLSMLGVGKAPLTVVWQTLLTTFALSGLTLNTIGAAVMPALGGKILFATVPLALILSFFLTGKTVRTVARLIPSASGVAATRRELVGCSGVVISSKVTGEFGEVRLQDPDGRTLRLICYTHDGDAPITEGTEVVVTGFEKERDRLYVSPVSKLIEGAGQKRRLPTATEEKSRRG